MCRGRWSDARHPSAKELGATVIVRLDLAEASAKVRSGGPVDQEEDLELEVWAGWDGGEVRTALPSPGSLRRWSTGSRAN